MSQAVHYLQLRNGIKFGNTDVKDSLLMDGLTDAFDNCHMGITAENVAKEFEISREEQDAFALKSQTKAKGAIANQHFTDEMTEVEIKSRKGTVIVGEKLRNFYYFFKNFKKFLCIFSRGRISKT